MSNTSPDQPKARSWTRRAGYAVLAVAGGAVGLAFLLSDEALAGPEGEELDTDTLTVFPADPQEQQEPWVDPGNIERLSIPLTPEEQGVDPNELPEIPVAEPTYIFINMDGENLVCNGGDSSTANSSIIACQYGFSGQYPSYGGTEAQRQTVMDAVKQDWAPFNMAVVNSRPNSGPYTMCMTGPANHPFGNGVLGIAPLDCNDYNPNNIVFAFHSAGQLGGGLGANTQATTISQEVAHAYGLEHVGSTSDIMNPYNAGGNPGFTDNCIGIQSNNGIVCGSQHTPYCPSGQQNSYQELLGMFGAADPDNQPPNVAVSYPSDGAVFEPGADFVITCEANDNQSVASVQLWINGDNLGTDGSAPYEWDVVGIPEGAYEIYCVAADDWDNTAMSPVVDITVEPGGDPGDSGGDSGGTTTGGDSGGDSGGTTGGDSGGDAGGDDVGDDGFDGGLPPGFGQDQTDSGCACSSDGGSGQPAWALLALLGLPLLRRRR